MQNFVRYRQFCGSEMFMPDPDFLVQDPGSQIRIRIKDFNPNIVSNLSEICSGMFIPDPDFFHSGSTYPKVKKAPDPGFGSATLVTSRTLFCFLHSSSKLKFVKFRLPKESQNLNGVSYCKYSALDRDRHSLCVKGIMECRRADTA
jgi:hypothetical protein